MVNQTQTDATGWEYSPAPETTQVRIEPKNKLFINGQFVSPKSRSWFSTTNPANNEKLADIACAGKADVESAVTSAKKALPKWSKLPVQNGQNICIELLGEYKSARASWQF